ncbi:DUF4136 domain-containing protein [Gilvimarinus algae]|uniref:DUF4136 domain-containing protein n=1 Tax=Gilvimarinus algae TaxID=3058037 RepID=A0ABT8TE23_9GAMM|nr:DUF4136 domain-containing protein [Gilvimarinus sp. SDUM040014]MDO3381638.1 DUF4136 domain-containing protein [Gilvimarinus sp. SDUM040014]
MTPSFLKTACVVLSALLLWGCVSQAPQEPRYTSSFISVSEPGFVLAPGDRFAWFAPAEVISDGEHSLGEKTIEHLRERFEQRMTEQGFQMVGSTDSADYWISAVIILGDAVSEQELVQRYDIAPALSNLANYEAGTLVMRLVSPLGRRTQWRGAMELFTDPSLKAEERQRRVDYAVDTFARHLSPK